jgi:uncharacterized Zn-binding protein involved in type VI secretion
MAAEGFYLVQGDKTTCGGKITTGAEDHTLFDKPVAREQDSVTCGKHAGLFKIAGGIDNDTIHGRRMAGTLDSYSTCPCKARFIPSMMQDTYETSSAADNKPDNAGEEIEHHDIPQARSELCHPVASPEQTPEPCAMTFTQNYKAGRGDLVYGISPERGKYISELYPGYQVDNRNLPPLVIDVYNNNVSATILMGNDISKVSRLVGTPGKLVKKIVVPPDLHSEVRKHRDGPDYLWSEYFNVGEHNSKFNIESIYREVARHYGKDDYHEMFTGMPAVMGYVPKLLWKRGSKLGIEMTAQNASHHLHFVLDGLLIEHIVKKIPPDGLSITASELRYAYRSRERLNGKIHFYQNKQEVLPPWETDPQLWQSYRPHSIQNSLSPQSAKTREPSRVSINQRVRSLFKIFRQKKV